MSKKILVPTDFTEEANCALNHAIGIAKAGGHEIIVLHIMNDKVLSFIKKEEITEEELRQKLKGLASDVSNQHHISTDYILRLGTLFETIGQVARETSSTYVVMGTHGVVGIKQKIFGARALKVAEQTREPMIIVQKRNISDHGYKKIVFPVDHDKSMEDRISELVILGKLFNSEVHLLKELEAVDTLTEQINMNYHQIKQQLDHCPCTIVNGQVDQSVHGFGKQILKYAEDIQADLILIKNYSDKKADEFIYGFNEEEIINNKAQIAVFCMN